MMKFFFTIIYIKIKFKERQDEDLFNIVRKQELRSEEDSDFGNFIARLRDIGNEIDNLLNDYDD